MAFQWTDIINNEVADSVRGKINALGQAMMYNGGGNFLSAAPFRYQIPNVQIAELSQEQQDLFAYQYGTLVIYSWTGNNVQFFVGSERGTQYLSGNLIVLPFK